MKITVNTNYGHLASGNILVNQLGPLFKKAGHRVTYNDWNHYSKYDLALFIAPDSEVIKAQQQNPRITTGIIDPKIMPDKMDEVRHVHFLVPTSFEQRDFFLRYNPHIFVFTYFPTVKPQEKKHRPKSPIVIGYHGNKLHLSNMFPQIPEALKCLGKEYKLELWLVYNVKELGKFTPIDKALGSSVKVRHLQWTPQAYNQYLAKADIGIVPALININQKRALKHSQLRQGFLSPYNKDFDFGYLDTDYVLRFKYSTNPGRIYPFAQLGIPVVADLYPSACQAIQNGYSGFLAYSSEGWYWALKQLIDSPQLRNAFSKNLRKYATQFMSVEKNFANLYRFIKQLRSHAGNP